MFSLSKSLFYAAICFNQHFLDFILDNLLRKFLVFVNFIQQSLNPQTNSKRIEAQPGTCHNFHFQAHHWKGTYLSFNSVKTLLAHLSCSPLCHILKLIQSMFANAKLNNKKYTSLKPTTKHENIEKMLSKVYALQATGH